MMSDGKSAGRLAAIEAKPTVEILINSPLTSRSGLWELTTRGGTILYDDFWFMADFIAEHYDREPGDEAEADSQDQPDPQTAT